MINGVVDMSYKSQSDLYLEDNISKYPAIELLCKLGYQYISPEECVAQRGGLYDVILKDVLRSQLHKLNQFTYGGITYKFTAENVEEILHHEIGKTFEGVLEDAGVYKCTPEGRAAFMRFVDSI